MGPAASRVHRNSVASTHIRCITTASLRANATLAFFLPCRLAMFIAHAFSQHHFTKRVSIVCAASYKSDRIIASPHREIWPILLLSPDWLSTGVRPRAAPTDRELWKRLGMSIVAT